MRNLIVAGVAFTALLGIVPAQAGSMGNGAAQRNGIVNPQTQTQAEQDQDVAKRCQAQPGLMSSQMCKDAMARHPEMFGAKPNSAKH